MKIILKLLAARKDIPPYFKFSFELANAITRIMIDKHKFIFSNKVSLSFLLLNSAHLLSFNF